MKWIDIEDIVEALEDKYPDEDIMMLRFTKLYQMILDIEDFDDDPKKSNEKILERIQGEWISLRRES